MKKLIAVGLVFAGILFLSTAVSLGTDGPPTAEDPVVMNDIYDISYECETINDYDYTTYNVESEFVSVEDVSLVESVSVLTAEKRQLRYFYEDKEAPPFLRYVFNYENLYLKTYNKVPSIGYYYLC